MVSRFRRVFRHCPPALWDLRRRFRSTQNPQTTNDFCNPHDPRTRLALSAPRLRDLADPPLAPVRGRNNNFRCRCQMGCFKERSNSRVANFRASSSTDLRREINENRLWKNAFFLPNQRAFHPTCPHATTRPKRVAFSGRRGGGRNRNSGSVDWNRCGRGCRGGRR